MTEPLPPILTADAIRAALPRIPQAFRGSPQFVSDPLSVATGRPVVAKVETVNPVGAFKGRGAWLALEHLAASEVARSAGVVVASSGNFGASVAYAGRALGVPVTVYVEEHANPAKVERIRGFDADVRLAGRDFDAAREHSQRHARESGATLLVDGEDPWIAVGAGTLALELTEAIERGDLPPLTAAYIPVGNGALIAGVGTWLRSASPQTRVIGVQAAGAPSMTLSWREKRPIETERADTRAGGIASRVPVPEALEMMEGVVDDMIVVDEDALIEGARALRAALGVTAELASGASWAGFLEAPPLHEGAVMILVTGSNAEPGVHWGAD